MYDDNYCSLASDLLCLYCIQKIQISHNDQVQIVHRKDHPESGRLNLLSVIAYCKYSTPSTSGIFFFIF